MAEFNASVLLRGALLRLADRASRGDNRLMPSSRRLSGFSGFERVVHTSLCLFVDSMGSRGERWPGRNARGDLSCSWEREAMRSLSAILTATARAGQIHTAGAPFYLTPNGVWLADAVPPQDLNCDGLLIS
jgi:hypothetical protein